MALSHWPSVDLPELLIGRCDRFAERVLEGYRNGENAASLAVSSHGAEHNWNLQARGKQGECALCIYFGGDPLRKVHWGRHCDVGYDLIAAGGLRIDVKTIKHEHRWLIWPVNKRSFYADKPFEVLVLVKENLPTFQIAGWVSKLRFFEEHEQAPRGHKLTEGTWYMDQSKLKPIERLMWAAVPQFVSQRQVEQRSA